MQQCPTIFRNKTLAGLLILGMLFQAFTAVFHISASVAGQSSVLSLFSRTIVICTGAGLKTVLIGADNQSDSGHKRVHDKCPVCFAHSSNVAALPPKTVFPFTPFHAQSRIYTELTEFTDSKPEFCHGRDPPESV